MKASNVVRVITVINITLAAIVMVFAVTGAIMNPIVKYIADVMLTVGFVLTFVSIFAVGKQFFDAINYRGNIPPRDKYHNL